MRLLSRKINTGKKLHELDVKLDIHNIKKNSKLKIKDRQSSCILALFVNAIWKELKGN